MICFASICPHPPILLQGKPIKTVTALKKLALEFKKAKPELVYIFSPHPDWGIEVPLHFLPSGAEIKPILTGFQEYSYWFEFGKNLPIPKQRTAVIASADLSHHSPCGPEFDHRLIDLLQEKKLDEILDLDQKFVAQAQECGLRAILALLGALSKINYQVTILSYENPYGVGYLVANFNVS